MGEDVERAGELVVADGRDRVGTFVDLVGGERPHDDTDVGVDAGNLGAICFFLKCRAGWRESMRIETTGPDGAPLNAPTPVFYLPEKDALLPGQEPPASQPEQPGNRLLPPPR